MPFSLKQLHNLRLGHLWLLAWILLLPALSLAAEFQITNHTCRSEGDAFVLDASIEFDFSDKAIEALQNGVPLTLEIHLQVRRKGAWVWERDVLDSRRRYQIRYHALASVYQVIDLQSGTRQGFVTREVAFSALGDILGLLVIQHHQLKKGKIYNIELKAALDLDSLPLPLRPHAYLSPAWNLSSEWSSCQIRR
ncbi:MAG: DUF4390 domain-containing protein [Gammaproteobacteria bacterium]|nr:DUF4390 domain-containing protein [Gammaproteobacteria bacterium]